ncbi:MAG: DUF4065 domain-containing protein [Nitrosopumilus sp. D6]|nr:MAG: DUF4065 domain-containing protein [Nitrosopumilus sp. D6]
MTEEILKKPEQTLSSVIGYSAILVADYLISKGQGLLTPLQIIKLIYISHGYTLAIHNRPLTHDRIEAWKYGPVLPVLYHALKIHASKPIPNLYYCGTNTLVSVDKREKFFNDVIEKPIKDILDRVLEAYGDMTGNELSAITHEKGTPWHICYRKNEFSIEIPDDIIKNHYTELKLRNERQSKQTGS